MDFKLIIKKLNQTLNQEENETFETWYNESQKHRDYFKSVKTNYNKGIDVVNIERGWYEISRKINAKKGRLYYKYAVAAAVFVALGSFWFFNSPKEKSTITKEYIKVKENPIKVGTDKATLTLADGSKIALEKGAVYKNKEASSNGEHLIYKSTKSDSNGMVKKNILTIPRGGQFYLVLSDGTKVWVNSETQLKYPVSFAPNEAREVELVYGEAYFDVSPSTQHNGSHFIVHNKNQEVEVLGTEFNIKAYIDDNHISTTLVEGKVTVKNEHNSKKLSPGYQSILTSESSVLTLSKVDVFEEVSWKDGLFSFKNMPLEDIMKVLSRWYDVDVVFENDKLRTLQFNGVFRKNLDINNILNIIKNTNEVNYSITNKTIIMK
jgi:ferric-dicitrate binding protein FerR (iron transport regulator)